VELGRVLLTDGQPPGSAPSDWEDEVPRKNMSVRMRELLAREGTLVLPGAYDCLSLRIAQQLGFEAAILGGLTCGGSAFGLPDVGVTTMAEMMGLYRNMAAAVDIPLIGDADDGFGELINVDRTTREAIRSGLAGFLIEDQRSPRRCPHIGGGDVISQDDMVRKLQVVNSVRAEEGPDFVVFARTYAGRVIGIEEAIRRGVAYAKAGADVIWVDLAYSDEAFAELKLIAREIAPHAHVVAGMAETTGKPVLSRDELQQLGYKIAAYPLTPVMAAARAVEKVLTELRDVGHTRDVVDDLLPLEEVSGLMGLERARAFEKKWVA
jgi:2-methylisocitrate lyase-like PEP mutase family enzyme